MQSEGKHEENSELESSGNKMEETGIEKMKNERERDVLPAIDHLSDMKELQEKNC